MPHEVVKHVAGRAYRYRVESYRDPQSGKVRGRWTYLGRVTESGTVAAPKRTTRERTRERLLEALERLLERRDYAEIAAGEIADEAGLAHGTFYRYFRDKRTALREAVEQVRESVERGWAALEGPIGTREYERARIRGWAQAVLDAPIERPGLLRAWYAVTDADPEVADRRAARRTESVTKLSAYLERCIAAGIVVLDAPQSLATALLPLFDAVLRAVAAKRDPGPDAIGGILAVFDRAIFGLC